MNKSAIKNFAIWARNKLIADITYKAGLLGISEKEIKEPLPQSTKDVQFFDIGTKEPYSISGIEIKQRDALAEKIRDKSLDSTLNTAFQAVVEEVAYTWFNRLIAVRFMEVNEYIPSRVRVISSESAGKDEPDLVTNPFDTDLEFTPYEKDRIMQLKQENQLDELFRLLFIKQCNALNAILPDLFEKTSDYTELLLNVAFTDKDGVVYHLVHDIPEADFKIRTDADEEAIKRGELTEEEAPSGQVEIIGWLYQYYNTEPKDETFALLKKNVKITKERIPAATQLFTPDWIVRYMVENSLGRLWLEGHPNDTLKSEWKYYLDETEQEEEVQKQLAAIREEYKNIKPEDIKVIDPCMGSGHILVYAFDVLMQMYESCGYSQRDAAKSIIENNIFGLDIDNRAYQLAYFALMMKARQYNRRILNGETKLHIYAIQESNGINRNQLKYFGAGMDEMQRNMALMQIQGLLDTFIDAKEYGSILNVDNYDWELLCLFLGKLDLTGQLSFAEVGVEDTQVQLQLLAEIGAVMAQKYHIVVTNPPYMGSNGMGRQLSDFVKKNYPDSKSDLFSVFMRKCLSYSRKNGNVALMTSYTWMFLSSYKPLRGDILKNQAILSLIQPEYHAFFEEAYVPICTFVLKNWSMNYKGEYICLRDFYGANVQSIKFLEAVSNRVCGYRYATNQRNFLKIPGMPIVYWMGDSLTKVYTHGILLGSYGRVSEGIKTGNNDVFLKLWFEINSKEFSFGKANRGYKWYPHHKGGEYRKWYGNLEWVIDWENDGARIRQSQNSGLQGKDMYFQEVLCWTKITSKGISLRYIPANCLFDSGSPAYRAQSKMYYVLALINSKVGYNIVNCISPTLNCQVGDIKNIPLIEQSSFIDKVESIALDNIRISCDDWNSNETSWNFSMHPLLKNRENFKGLLQTAFQYWRDYKEEQFNTLKNNETELNRIFIQIYNLQVELSPAVDENDVTINRADFQRDIRSFISYSVGCMFGRYSLGVDGLVYAGGQWDGSKYSTFIPDKDNIIPITDEEYFEDDIVGLFVAFVKKVYGVETLEENLDFIARALGNKGDTSREIIRNYFLKNFFKDHCKIYQKRPVYWFFDSGKANGFKGLIYMHRYDENTIGNLRIDYLHKMQRVYEREIVRMQETIDNSTNAREVAMAEKRKDKLTKQLQETKDYDEKIAHLALARIAIDLDDGVKVNYEKVQTGTDGKKLEVLAKV